MQPDNTDLHYNGKYHFTADLLFDWFGFDQASKAVDLSTKAKKLNPNKKGGQPYSDTSPHEVNKSSLLQPLAAFSDTFISDKELDNEQNRSDSCCSGTDKMAIVQGEAKKLFFDES